MSELIDNAYAALSPDDVLNSVEQFAHRVGFTFSGFYATVKSAFILQFKTMSDLNMPAPGPVIALKQQPGGWQW